MRTILLYTAGEKRKQELELGRDNNLRGRRRFIIIVIHLSASPCFQFVIGFIFFFVSALPLFFMRYMLAPVSYTHLDVYKRQALIQHLTLKLLILITIWYLVIH